MKPYIRVLWNNIKLHFCGRKCAFFASDKIQLFGWNTRLVFANGSKISFSKRISNDGRLSIIVGNDGELSIGEYVYFNEGSMISCQDKIEIGDHCKFGPNVTIIDNDHCFDACNGVNNKFVSLPISIGNNCWIGANVVILKGTVVEDNCVIGAGCIIKGNIPKGSIVSQDRKLNIKSMKS